MSRLHENEKQVLHVLDRRLYGNAFNSMSFTETELFKCLELKAQFLSLILSFNIVEKPFYCVQPKLYSHSFYLLVIP